MHRTVLVVSTLMLVLGPAASHSSLWAGKFVAGDCLHHPLASPSDKLGGPAAHVRPSLSAFLNSAPTSVLCPGATHVVVLAYPDRTARECMITSSSGYLVSALNSLHADACENRLVLATHTAPIALNLTLPATASGAVELRTTSVAAAASNGAHTTSSHTFVIADPASDTCQATLTRSTHTMRTARKLSTQPPAVPPMLTVQTVGCANSTLGYACARKTAHVAVLHYSVGGPVPDNACTWGLGGSQAVAQLLTPELQAAGWGVVHFALEAETTGYVALGFPPGPAIMVPSDVMFAYVDDLAGGAVFQEALHIQDLFPGPQNAVTPSWAVYKGVMQTPGNTSAARTISCFGRLAKVASSAAVAASVPPPALERGPASGMLDVRGLTQFTFALGDEGVDGFAYHNRWGAFFVDMNDPAAPLQLVKGEPGPFVLLHAILMLTAWAGLAPLGVLISRHRWLMGSKSVGALGWSKEVWFLLHVGCALGVVGLTAGGFALAYTKFARALQVTGKGTTHAAHHVLGVIVMALACLQVLVAVGLRPQHQHRLRSAWNHLHWWLGRTLVAVAFSNIILGAIVIAEKYATTLEQWLVPSVVPPLAMLLIILALDLWRARKSSFAQLHTSGKGAQLVSVTVKMGTVATTE